ncbi:MAG: DUF885 domain-containing protein [Acidobacteria bacterium]|nr:MAG: DUF885 domain-containing protein [Acidobacteriota bacterium]
MRPLRSPFVHSSLRRVAVAFLLPPIVLACATGEQQGDERSAQSRALEDLFARQWEWRLDNYPELATNVGDYRANDQLTSVAPVDLERRAEETRGFLAELEAILADAGDDEAALSRTDRINADILRRQLRNSVVSHEFGDWQIPLNADSGFHIGFSRLASNVPFDTTQHYEDYIARMRAWPRLVDQQIANMRLGLARGFVLPKVVLAGYDSTYDSHLVDEPTESVFWEPFEEFPIAVPESEHERLREAGRVAIREAIVPGYRAFSDFMKGEYIPGCSDSIAATDLPDGEAYYDHLVESFTTLDLSADEVHEIGLREVARIRADMEALLERIEWKGSFDDFLTFLRTDSEFYAQTPRDLLEKASYLSKKADGQLPRFFGTLPRLPYTVEPVPDHMAPKYTSGRYVGPPEGSVRPGIYWVNTYALGSRPLYNLPALTLHEAVPGHHLQNALAKEQEKQPDFRRTSYISAFGEGWGLYCEFLGIEMGMYETPYEEFGRMTYEMWRAVRLVVDTGMHAKGWTRQQTLDYLAENTALPLHEIETETDRYISWPGQALAYKMGEIKIRELRTRAEQALGDRFDIRAFHDAVLAGGSVPLPVLEESIDLFIAEALEG